MRYLKRRITTPREYDAHHQKQRELSTARVKRCTVCTFEFPEEDVIIEDGQEKCPMCADRYTAEYLADEARDVATVKEESARNLVDPPQFSQRTLLEPRAGAVTAIADSTGKTVSQTSPLLLKRTVASTLVLSGQYFTSACTTTYPSGITDAAAPVIAPAVPGGTPATMTLSLVAAVGMTPGAYSLTFNDGVSQNGHLYPNIFAVR